MTGADEDLHLHKLKMLYIFVQVGLVQKIITDQKRGVKVAIAGN